MTEKEKFLKELALRAHHHKLKYNDKPRALKLLKSEFKEKLTDQEIEKALNAIWWRPRSKLKVHCEPEFNGNLKLVVSLWSATSKDRISKSERSFSRYDLSVNLAQIVGTMAGALAEYQNGLYSDNHDPEECAKEAEKCLREMLAQAEADRSKLLTGVTVGP